MKKVPHPLGHVILVKVDDVERVTKGGIILDTAFDSKERQRQEDARTIGTVVELGPTAYEAFGEPWVKVGDIIHFKRYSGVEVRDENKVLYRLMNDDDAIAKYDPEGEENNE